MALYTFERMDFQEAIKIHSNYEKLFYKGLTL